METIKELLVVGKQFFDNKQYTQAESHLRRALDKGARYADVLNMLGVISHVEGRFASSIEYFREAVKINPRYTEAILNLAVLYNDLGQYAEAKKLYNLLRGNKTHGASKIEPVLRGKLSNLHADIGDIYRSIGLYSHASDEYLKALNLNPNYYDIRTKLGQALREKGLFPDSLKEFKTVIRSNKKYTPAIVQLGITYYVMGKTKDAIKSWKDALKSEPANEYALMYLRLCDAMAEKKNVPLRIQKKKAKSRK